MNDDDLLKPGDTIAHSNKQLMESPEVEKIAQTVIEREDLDFGPAEIGYFLIYPNLSKYKAAKCIKTSREVEYYSGNNYLIELSGVMWDMMDQKTREMVLFNQLLHVDPEYNDKNQEWMMKVSKSDFTAFYGINVKYDN